MNDIVIDVPLEKIKEGEKLFEYISFKKARKTPEVYQAKVHNAFINYFTQSSSHSSTSHTHHRNKIIIKNIGNMKRTHLHNALSYTIEKSYQESMNIFDDMDFHTELLSQHKKCAIDYLGNFVGVYEILKDWQKDFSSNKNTNEALHLVFSLNEIHSPTIMEILLQSAQNTLQSINIFLSLTLIKTSHIFISSLIRQTSFQRKNFTSTLSKNVQHFMIVCVRILNKTCLFFQMES
ncbi:Hypothetical protein BN2458_PEG0143 [Helicobacter typhlonius]|uniref:Uncharacterized protein n=1 Tax=Helicobacter typhlonius TaxID=76936 RepID=A0A0S4PTG6_9HELI|nr:hypothetical protein [Helicobacter typhlonius]CUU39030.1 Hypothetical protein BN2458_PEG0143 [Helicobacter typhlonius]